MRRAWPLLLLLGACGAPAPAGPPAAAAEGPKPASPASSAAAGRLHGTWEIVRYQSTRPIPPEAMPLMGELFDVLRVTFDGGNATFVAGKTREEKPYSLADESDDGFRLVVHGGMFDGAKFRAEGNDRFEVVDEGDRWPGKSVLQRTH